VTDPHPRHACRNAAFLLVFLLFVFVVIEAGYRILDPFPYYSDAEIEATGHGRLSTYDDTLGWKGVPWGDAELVTISNRVRISHNSRGFRDIEHSEAADRKPAVVFLGDSFAWGYEVEAEEMFVNRLRDMLPGYSLFNLSHRGYGTDQELLTFEAWRYEGPMRLVVLMFCENDILDNNSAFRYGKSKPKFKMVDDGLVLVGVPVAESGKWRPAISPKRELGAVGPFRRFLLRSNFVHDVAYRLSLLGRSKRKRETPFSEDSKPDTALTVRILERLDREVKSRGAALLVVFIPSKAEVEQLDDRKPYQTEIAGLCRRSGIESLDLAPRFSDTRLRTYHRLSSHWNSRGHRVAAEALYDYITQHVTQ
jgi:lysophospholipase L1-like esterase